MNVSQQQPILQAESVSIRRARSVCVIVLGMMLAAFAIHVAATHALFGGLGKPWYGDENSYVPLAIALAEGRGFVDPDGSPNCGRTPGIPFLVSMVFRITGPQVPAARVLMCAIAALLVPACYLLGHSLAGVRAGLLAAAAATLFPNWLYFSGYVLSDLASGVTIAATAWLLVEGRRRDSVAWFAAAGLVWGGGVLVRPTSLSFVPGVVLWLCLTAPTWRRRVVVTAATCGALACVVAPWSIRNALVFGRSPAVSSQGGVALWIGNNPNATGILVLDYRHYEETRGRLFPRADYPSAVSVADAYKAEAIRFIRENPRRFLRLCAIRLWEFWKVYSPRVPWLHNAVTIASFGVALPFFLLQLLRHGWRRGPEMLFLLLIASQTAVHTVFTSIVRYRIPIEPLVIAMASAGFFWAVDRLSKRQGVH